MNTNPSAMRILCYGDSNTWGQKPDKSGRLDPDVRWTGILQNALGDSCEVIEEGLGSRTTDLDYDKKPGRNGKTYLVPCLGSHNPLDVVVLMLGTNDLKFEYSRKAEEIAEALKGLVKDIRLYASTKNNQPPYIVLVSPIHIDETAPRFYEFYTDYYNAASARESLRLAEVLSRLAEETNCSFIDAARCAHPGEDGVHMSQEAHKTLAGVMHKTITELIR